MSKKVKFIALSFLVLFSLVSCLPTGALIFIVSGEKLATDGFTTKDGYKLSFDKVLVHVENITAYELKENLNTENFNGIKGVRKKARITGSYTADLVNSLGYVEIDHAMTAPGFYNAIEWSLTKATNGEMKGYSIILKGTAEKNGLIKDFIIKTDTEYKYVCGEYVGEYRLGKVKAETKSHIEMTFHLDHIFGIEGNDEHSSTAVGFAPFMKLEKEGKIEVDMKMIKSGFSDDDYSKLVYGLKNVGHVGEGHCHCE